LNQKLKTTRNKICIQEKRLQVLFIRKEKKRKEKKKKEKEQEETKERKKKA